jgi:hypothetical protein
LAGLEQEHGAIGEDVRGGREVGGFDVAGCDDAELLVRFVEIAFRDPVNTYVREATQLYLVLVGEREITTKCSQVKQQLELVGRPVLLFLPSYCLCNLG